jgi:hypothetical protein
MRRPTLKFMDRIWISPATLPVKMPVGLSHIDSDLCWCEPIVEIDENGDEVLVHTQVTWN